MVASALPQLLLALAAATTAIAAAATIGAAGWSDGSQPPELATILPLLSFPGLVLEGGE